MSGFTPPQVPKIQEVSGSQTSRIADYPEFTFASGSNASRTAYYESADSMFGPNASRTAYYGFPVNIFTPPKAIPDPAGTHTFELQVFRNGFWVDIPVANATGTVGNAQAGQLTVTVPDNQGDQYRSILYEGEKIRAYRGPVNNINRCWTGYVDSPTPTDQGGITRSYILTDYIQELNTAIFIEGVIYDTFAPNDAVVDVITRAINTGQFVPTDDSGNSILPPFNAYEDSNGNDFLYFPDLLNPDGSIFHLASGTSGSYTPTGTEYNAQQGLFTAPASTAASSGNGVTAPYLAFLLPQQFLVPGTVSFTQGSSASFTLASSSTTLPPPLNQIVVDYYNGIMYLNPGNANNLVAFTGNFWQSPLWQYAPGSTAGDTISEIFDKTGFRWHVTGKGKIYSIYVDFTKAISKVYRRNSYITNQIQVNRDRRNVIICEGFNGTTGQLLVSKAVNTNDILLPPPQGLGKKQYAIFQDPTWVDQATVDNAAYFAAIHIGRRGKITTLTIVDDSTINLEDVIGFAGSMPETLDSDLFYVEQMTWSYNVSQGAIQAQNQLTATSQAGTGWFFVGPPLQTGNFGAYDFTKEVTPTVATSGYLTPLGGTYHSYVPIEGGLTLTYESLVSGTEKIEIFGADSSYFGPYSASRDSSPQPRNLTVPIDISGCAVDTWFALKVTYADPISGSKAIYRDFFYVGPGGVGPAPTTVYDTYASAVSDGEVARSNGGGDLI